MKRKFQILVLKTLLSSGLSFILLSCGNAVTKDSPNTQQKSDCEQAGTDHRSEVSLYLGCGIAATTSVQLDSLRSFVKDDHEKISKGLYSPDLLVQVLSVVALEALSHKHLIILSAEQVRRIDMIKSSKRSCYVCQGCAYHFQGVISDIFAGRDHDALISMIKNNLGLAGDESR